MMNNAHYATIAQLVSESAAPIVFYLLIINIAAFITMGADKFKAVKRLFRIPEAILFLEALLGGTLGSMAGMIAFHHKVSKPKFRIGMPLILLMQIVLLLFIFSYSQIQFL